MSLNAILRQIETDGEERVEKIRAQAEEQARNLIEVAQVEAKEIYQSAFEQALHEDPGEKARILNPARFEAVCLVGQVREKLIQQVLELACDALSHARTDPTYPDLLKAILIETLPGSDGQRSLGDRFFLEADPRDQQLLEYMLAEAGYQLPVKYVLNCWGGLNGCSQDGRLRVLNTLETRLERLKPAIRKNLTNMLLPQQVPESTENIVY